MKRKALAPLPMRNSSKHALRVCGTFVALGALLACTGEITGGSEPEPNPTAPVGNAGSGAAPTTSVGGAGNAPAAGGATVIPGGGGASVPPSTGAPVDPASELEGMPADPSGAGPMPVRELTSREYLNTVAELLGDRTTLTESDVLVERTPPTFEYFAFRTPNDVGTFEAETLQLAAEKLAQAAITKLSSIMPCTPSNAGAEAACATQFINTFGAKAYRRPLDAAETGRLTALYNTGRTTLALSFNQSIGLLIEAMLQSPNFYYLTPKDPGPAKVDATGKVELGAHTLANRLSYFLWGAPPDAALLDAAKNGQLGTEAQVEAQARRMLKDPKARLMAADFVNDLLDMDTLIDRQKDAERYGMFTALSEPMRLETERFASTILIDGTGKFSDLLTSTSTFVNQPLAGLYGISGITGNDLKPAMLNASQRAGVLTLAGFLANTGSAEGSLPPRRGRVVFSRFLCTELPPPNEEVPLPAPETANVTTRERFEQHSSNPCAAACHGILDPLGFAFEHYDGIGAYRETDHGVPVNASAEFAIDGTVKVPFKNAVELSKALATSTKAQSCYTKQMLRYAFRRMETDGDIASLQSAHGQFKTSSLDTRELIVGLVKSRTFRFRTPGNAEVLQ